MDVEAQNIAMICYICRNPAPNTETFEQICHDQQIQNNHVTNKKMINWKKSKKQKKKSGELNSRP
jgi:hypothetical protein